MEENNRRKNLTRLLSLFETQKELIYKARVSQASISNTLTGKRGLGTLVARTIEQNLGLQPGWLDMDDPPLPENINNDIAIEDRDLLVERIVDEVYHKGLVPFNDKALFSPIGMVRPDLVIGDPETGETKFAIEIKQYTSHMGKMQQGRAAQILDSILVMGLKANEANVPLHIIIIMPQFDKTQTGPQMERVLDYAVYRKLLHSYQFGFNPEKLPF